MTAPASADPDVHPREDAVTVVRAALLALGPLAVDPHDADDMDAYATAGVSALMRAGMLGLGTPTVSTGDLRTRVVDVLLERCRLSANRQPLSEELCMWEPGGDGVHRPLTVGAAADVLMPVLVEVTAERDQATRDRDLAIAHDTQPYPTAHAYEAACRALAKHKAAEDRYRAALERIAGDGGGLDVFLPVETLQGIAWEALGGDA